MSEREKVSMGIDPGTSTGICLWGQRGRIWSTQQPVGRWLWLDVLEQLQERDLRLVGVAIEDHVIGGDGPKNPTEEQKKKTRNLHRMMKVLRHQRGRAVGFVETVTPLVIRDVAVQTWRKDTHGKTRRRPGDHKDACQHADVRHASLITGGREWRKDESAAIVIASWAWGLDRIDIMRGKHDA